MSFKCSAARNGSREEFWSRHRGTAVSFPLHNEVSVRVLLLLRRTVGESVRPEAESKISRVAGGRPKLLKLASSTPS